MNFEESDFFKFIIRFQGLKKSSQQTNFSNKLINNLSKVHVSFSADAFCYISKTLPFSSQVDPQCLTTQPNALIHFELL